MKILQLSSASSYFGRIPSDKFDEFKKAISSHNKDIMLYAKQSKEITHIILVVFPTISSDAFAEIIQKHDAKIEAVPNLNGKPNQIITSEKDNLQTKKQRLKQINDELNKISEKYYTTLVEVEEPVSYTHLTLPTICSV